ncbi:hypothetical protein ACFVH4_10025 [Nocardia ignorata]|uniref:hypothetical protein n=1 Tax=Nocardia ignorata TaxID=145285 RepID=UPI003644BB00
MIALRHELDDTRLANRKLGHPMASMQNPNILDWRLSPGSFSLAKGLMVGPDGCESLLPSNLSTQRFRFAQVARVPNTLWENVIRGETKNPVGRNEHVVASYERYRLGRVFEYTSEWFPIGHSLGPLAYSLPLAPGEMVKIAVLDWSRSDVGTRDEQTSLSESIIHDQLRDRSLTESVHAVLKEWQRGGSVMGGVAGSGSYGAGTMAIGGAASLGGAYTTSSGTRDLTADTSQRIADSFHQATSAMRELRSTVVVQTSQAENSTAQTRVVANYNHSHALTILYYEVLRHYRVVTRLAKSRPALLVDYRMRRFDFNDEGQMLAYRQELESLLLDERLKGCFDALSRVLTGRAAFEAAKLAPKPPSAGDAWFDRFSITITTGGDGGGGTDGGPYLDLKLTNGAKIQTHQIGPREHDNPRYLGHPGYGNFEADQNEAFGLKAQAPVRWSDLRGFIVGLAELETGGDWRINHLKLEGFTLTGDSILLYDAGYGKDLPDDAETTEFLTNRPPPPTPGPVIESFVTAADLQIVDLLIKHLEAHRHHYDRALWLIEDPNHRAVRFESFALDGMPLMDIIENRAVEITGDWVAFPLAADTERQVNKAFDFRDVESADSMDTFVEQLLTLPSRGVFAEAKLGHCNASEVLDPDRFWDWQTSPIPHHAPEILPVDTGSRAKDLDGLDPTAFPNSLVNIVNPGALPDPTGLAAALKVIGTPEVFRDMSGADEVGSLLEKLSDNATAMAKQSAQSSRRQDLVRDIRSADELSAEKKAALVEDLLKREVAGNGDEATGGSETDSGSTGGTAKSDESGAPPPESAAGSGGSAVPAIDPLEPKTPSPPSKPKLPAPTPQSRGLGFHLNFQRAQVSTTATGQATVTVRSSGPSGGLMPSGGYIPGVAIGPPTADQAKAMPEHWDNQQFLDGGLFLRSARSTAPGQITITVVYDVDIVDKADLVTGVFVPDSADRIVDRKARTITLTNSVGYGAPAQGDVVRLKVTPKTQPISITAGTSTEMQAEIASKVGGKAILEAEISGSHSSGSGESTERTITMTYLTGGLDIVPE